MTTIARNWKKRVAAVATTAKFCEVYDSDSGHLVPCSVADALKAWENFRPARLTEDVPGEKWTVRIHSNRWYQLTVRDPEEIKAEQRAKAAEVAAARPPLPAPAPAARRSQDAPSGPCALFPPGFDDQTKGAAVAITGRHRAAGVIGDDALGRNMGPLAAGVVARTVKKMRRQGKSHEQIREHFQQVRAEAVAAGQTGRAAAAETFLSVHAGMMADLAKLSADADQGPAALATPVQKALAAVREAPAPGCWCGQTPCPMPGQHAGAQAVCDAINQTAPALPPSDSAPAGPVEEERAPVAPVDRPAPAPAVAALPAPAAERGKLPPHEEGYEPVRCAKPYPVRRALAALEAAGVPVKGDGVEFWLTVNEAAEGDAVNVAVLDIGDAPKPQPAGVPGRKADRWELRRAEVLAALLRGGLTDAVMLRGGVRLRVARPAPRAATLVVLGESDYSGEKFIDRPVSLPQYPQVTGWTLRKRWGKNYLGPMTPWMEHEDGTIVGHHAKDEQAAAEALCHLYGLLRPVRVTSR